MWDTNALERVGTRAVVATLGVLGLAELEADLSILGGDDAHIARLNKAFRGKAAPTNVLSWPAQSLAPDTPGGRPCAPKADAFGEVPLGDVALAHETCAREATAQGKPFEHHVTHLIVHGVLHLLGYDHETSQDANRMETLERDILGKLDIDDPY